MREQTTITVNKVSDDFSPSLQRELNNISDTCTNCKLCQKECEFLRKYGKPKEIADS